MWTSETILQFLSPNRLKLREMGVRKIGLFGSYARGEQRPDSDIDILVGMEDSRFKPYAKVWNFLEDSFGCKVDLVRDKVKQFTENLDFDAFKRVDSVLFNLMTIREAIKNIPDDVREKMPEVEWHDIGRFRDYVVHHYFNIKLDTVWSIVRDDLPQLRVQVEQLLEKIQKEQDE